MKKTLILLGALGTLLAAGCSTTVNTVSRADPVGSPSVVQDERIITDRSLGNAVSILQVNEGTVSGNLTKIQVQLANNKSKSLTINYLIEWYDLDGMQVAATASTWKSLRFMGKEQKAISAIGPNPRAVDFVLKLQEAK